MSGLNFDNIESASSEVRESSFKSVKPGVQTLMITGIEGTVASTGNAGIVVTFESKEAEASFNERFWLSAGALPRVQYLVEKFTGVKMTGGFDGEGQVLADNVATALSSKLVGKSKTVVVDGEMRTREKDGKVYTNTYPMLRFAGFVDPEGKAAEPIITDKTVAVAVKPTGINLADQTEDLPF